jgi:hypothetical protein
MGFNGIQWDLQLTPITSYNYMVCDIYSYSVYVGYNPTYDWWCPKLYWEYSKDIKPSIWHLGLSGDRPIHGNTPISLANPADVWDGKLHVYVDSMVLFCSDFSRFLSYPCAIMILHAPLIAKETPGPTNWSSKKVCLWPKDLGSLFLNESCDEDDIGWWRWLRCSTKHQ